jgi:hypothetical protein
MVEKNLGSALQGATVGLIAWRQMLDQDILMKLRSSGEQSCRKRDPATGTEVP